MDIGISFRTKEQNLDGLGSAGMGEMESGKARPDESLGGEVD